jgi:DNA-binding response OmpR family regulator
VPHVVVLSVGLDANVLSTRALILQSAGYTVVSAISVKEAVSLLEASDFEIQASDFDIVVLCHTLSAKDCERLISMVRSSGSHMPIVTVEGSSFSQQRSMGDATVDKEPVAFLRAMREVLRDHAQPVTQRREA